MAQRVQVILEDDYDGGHADETVTFGFEGAEYEIDLSSGNASALREALAPWVSRARKTGGKTKRTSSPAGRPANSRSREVRAWAQAQGYEVNARGRVSAEINAAYQKAHA